MLLSLSCGGTEAPNPESPNRIDIPSSGFFSGPIRGHEDLTRFGVERSQLYIQYTLGMPSPFPAVSSGDWGMSTSNRLVKGNYNTDWYPPAEMLQFYGLSSDTSQTAWQEDSRLQPLHALRNHPNDLVEGPQMTCFRVQNFIVAATDKALGYFAAGDKDRGLFWTGHATHTLQDTFAFPHVWRESLNGLRGIYDFCTYGAEYPGVCYHPTVSGDDSVWRGGLTCGVTDRSWGCLTDLGQAASNATAGYLYAVAKLIKTGKTSSRTELVPFFELASYYPWGGYLPCSKVPLPRTEKPYVTVALVQATSNAVTITGHVQRPTSYVPPMKKVRVLYRRPSVAQELSIEVVPQVAHVYATHALFSATLPADASQIGVQALGATGVLSTDEARRYSPQVEVPAYGNYPSLYMGWITEYSGRCYLRVIASAPSNLSPTITLASDTTGRKIPAQLGTNPWGPALIASQWELDVGASGSPGCTISGFRINGDPLLNQAPFFYQATKTISY